MPDGGTHIPQADRGPTHDERVLALLSDRQPHSHHELYGLHVIAHSRVASLRKKGYRIDAWRDGDTYMYRLAGLPEEAAEPQDGAPVADRAPAASSDIPASSDLPSADWGDGMSEPVQLVIV